MKTINLALRKASMKHIIITFCLVILPYAVNAKILLEPALKAHIEQAVTAGQYQSVIIAYMQDGETVVKSFGTLVAGSDAAPNADTLFELSSNSKTFAATLLGIMAARGDVALDDPVNMYLPQGVRIASFDGVDVTLQDLATHMSGLPLYPEDYAIDENDPTPHSEYSLDELWASINAFKPTRKSGEKWLYSAFNFGVLSQALAHHMGKNYFSLVKEEILEPLDMTSTYLHLPDSERYRFAQGHLPGGEKTDNLIDHGALYAAGSMFTTVNDLLKFMRAHMSEGDSTIAEGIALTHPLYDTTHGMGLGWENTENSINRNHFGTGGGHRSYIGFNKDDPERRGVIIFTNTRFGIVDIGHHALTSTHPLPDAE